MWKWIERFWYDIAATNNSRSVPREKGVATLSYLVYLAYMPDESGC